MKGHLEVLRSNWLSLAILVAGIGLFGGIRWYTPPAETVSAPNGSGAMAIRLNGEWDCTGTVANSVHTTMSTHSTKDAFYTNWDDSTTTETLTSGSLAYPRISTTATTALTVTHTKAAPSLVLVPE